MAVKKGEEVLFVQDEEEEEDRFQTGWESVKTSQRKKKGSDGNKKKYQNKSLKKVPCDNKLIRHDQRNAKDLMEYTEK